MENDKNNSKFDLNIIWKECAKDYKLKKRDYLLWTVNNNLIFSIFSKLSIVDKDYYLDIICNFKPLWADDLFWDITNSKYFDYKKTPMSFRVIGSNIAQMKTIYENQVKLGNLDMDKTKEIFYNEVEKIIQIIKLTRDDTYNINNESIEIDTLVAIHNKDYKKAKSILRRVSCPYNRITGAPKKDGVHINVWIFRQNALKYIRLRWFQKLKQK